MFYILIHPLELSTQPRGQSLNGQQVPGGCEASEFDLLGGSFVKKPSAHLLHPLRAEGGRSRRDSLLVLWLLWVLTSFDMALFPDSMAICARGLCCSVAQSCPTLCDPMDCSTPGFPVLHHLPELAQTHVHGIDDANLPSRSLSSPSPPALGRVPGTRRERGG